MKNGSFKGLLMREFFMSRKALKLNLLTFFVAACLGIVTALSKQYGNLALIVELLMEKKLELFVDSIDMWIRLMPAFFGLFFATVTMDSIERDDACVWRCFRKTTPVGSFRLALAKTVFALMNTLLSLVCVFLYMTLVGMIIGSYATKAEIGVLMFFLLLIVFLNVLGMASVTFFHSQDKGMLFVIGIAVAGCVVGYDKLELLEEQMNGILDFYDLIKGFLPYVPVAFVLLFGALLGVMTYLYQRKEA